jgi:hypothetical protein
MSYLSILTIMKNEAMNLKLWVATSNTKLDISPINLLAKY